MSPVAVVVTNEQGYPLAHAMNTLNTYNPHGPKKATFLCRMSVKRPLAYCFCNKKAV